MKKKRLRIEWLDIVIHVFLILLVVIILYPIFNLTAISFSSNEEFVRGAVTVYPRGFTTGAYRAIFRTGSLARAYLNSFYYTFLGTAINMLFTTTMAFALSRPTLMFRRFYILLALLPMYFSGGLIPSYLNVLGLGLNNSVWALVLPGAVSSWNLIIMRTFFASLPYELDEAAHIDGAGDLRVFFMIVLPLSTAGLATVALFYMAGHWNSWFSAMIYLRDAEKHPLQLIIRQIVIEGQQMKEKMEQNGRADDTVLLTQEGIKYATIIISILPMLAIYPFIQRYFVKGVMIGSIKG